MTAPGRAGAGAFTNRGNTACLLGSDRGCCAFRFFASPHLCVRLTFLPTVNAPAGAGCVHGGDGASPFVMQDARPKRYRATSA